MEQAHYDAARCLSRGDPLGALNAVAGDESGHGRALRGIALAQLQELEPAARELRAALAAFENEPLYRARALAALAEVAAARRELGTALDALADAAEELGALGDHRNASWARLVRARMLLLIGSTDEARAELGRAAAAVADDPVVAAAHGLAAAAISVRGSAADEALAWLDDALALLGRDEHPLLAAELDAHRAALTRPVARVDHGESSFEASMPTLAKVFRGGAGPPDPALPEASRWFVVDGIARRALFCGEDSVDLSRRDVLFELLSELGRAWPGALETDTLVDRVFDGPPGDESHRDRVKVELGRLRRLLPTPASIEALGGAWRLDLPADTPALRVSLNDEESMLSALLSDGQPWAVRDLALAIGSSPRTVQRALAELVGKGDAEPVGQARARRWVAPNAPQGIASQMFLLGLLDPVDPRASKPERG